MTSTRGLVNTASALDGKARLLMAVHLSQPRPSAAARASSPDVRSPATGSAVTGRRNSKPNDNGGDSEMASGPFTIDFKANATEALRDINRASRRLNFARYVWPMVAGAALGLVGAVVGFILGATT